MTTVIDINPVSGYIVALTKSGTSQFDTRKRYLRAGTDSARFPIPQDITFKVRTYVAQNFPSWRYTNGAFAIHYEYPGDTAISYDPPFTLVNI